MNTSMLYLMIITVLISMISGEDTSFLRGYISSNEVSSSTCFCTTVPCPVEGDNKLTEGGGSTGVYTYVLHNNYPVISSATVTLHQADLDHGTDTTSCTQNYSRSLDDDGVQDCDAGHILANRLGGPGSQPINIFPQDLHVNRGAYAQFEGKIYDCMSTGSVGYLSWNFYYETELNTKPNKVIYQATFTGSTCTSLYEEFTN